MTDTFEQIKKYYQGNNIDTLVEDEINLPSSTLTQSERKNRMDRLLLNIKQNIPTKPVGSIYNMSSVTVNNVDDNDNDVDDDDDIDLYTDGPERKPYIGVTRESLISDLLTPGNYNTLTVKERLNAVKSMDNLFKTKGFDPLTLDENKKLYQWVNQGRRRGGSNKKKRRPSRRKSLKRKSLKRKSLKRKSLKRKSSKKKSSRKRK